MNQPPRVLRLVFSYANRRFKPLPTPAASLGPAGDDYLYRSAAQRAALETPFQKLAHALLSDAKKSSDIESRKKQKVSGPSFEVALIYSAMVQAESREMRERSGSDLIKAESRAAEYTRRVSLGLHLRPKDIRAFKR